MATERVEQSAKHIDYHDLLLTKLLYLGLHHGFPPPYKLTLDVKTEKEDKSGTKTIRVEPYLLGNVRQADLEAWRNNKNKFLLHNPYDEAEKYSYLVNLGERDWGDGEKTRHIVISRVPSPNGYENKREWVKVLDETSRPWTSQAEFQDGNVQFPTILITLYGQSVSINYGGELDKFLGEIYAFFPAKQEETF